MYNVTETVDVDGEGVVRFVWCFEFWYSHIAPKITRSLHRWHVVLSISTSYAKVDNIIPWPSLRTSVCGINVAFRIKAPVKPHGMKTLSVEACIHQDIVALQVTV